MAIVFNRKNQRFVSFFMCFVIVAMIFAFIPFTKASANPALAIPVVADAVEVLLILGVTFVTVDIAYQVTQEFLKQNPNNLDWLNDVRLRNAQDPNDPNLNGNKIKFFPGDVNMLKKFYEDAKAFFKDKNGVVSIDDPSKKIYGNVTVVDIANKTDEDLYNCAQYSSTEIASITSLSGAQIEYKALYWELSDAYTGYMLYCNNNRLMKTSDDPYGLNDYRLKSYYTANACKFGFMKVAEENGITYLNPYLVANYKFISTGINYSYKASYSNKLSYGSLAVETSKLVNSKTDYAYKNDPKYNPDTVLTHMISTIVNTGELEIDTKPTHDIMDDVDDIAIADRDQDDGLDDTGIKDGIILDPTSIIDPVPVPQPNPSPTTNDEDYKPSITAIPNIGGIWDYVKDFLKYALIWMQLWYSGFIQLPFALKTTLWALVVITIFIGLLGVFLK